MIIFHILFYLYKFIYFFYLFFFLEFISLPGKDMSQHAIVRTCTVYVLEDLRISSVVPKEPEQPVLVENDEEAPLCVGDEEEEERLKKNWIENRPHRACFVENCEGKIKIIVHT